MTRHRHVAALCLAVGCSSAGAGADGALNTPVIDTLAGGIERVTNTGPTAWTDTNGWKLVLERTITPEPESPGEIGLAGGIVADSRGAIYVLDHKPASIKVYGPDGAYLRTIGRDGGGPGEFRFYGRLMIARDTLVHHDSRQTRTQTFTGDGSFIRVWSTMCCYNRPLQASDDGIVPIPGMIQPDSLANREVAALSGAGAIRYRLDGTVVDTMIFPPEPEQPFWKMGDKDDWSINTIPFQPGLSSRFLPSGELAWGVQNSYQLVLSRNGSDTVRIFEYKAGTTPLPDSLRTQAVADMVKEDERWRAVAKLSDVPTTYPLWTSIAVDGDNNIWVLLPGPRGEADHWDVFTHAGVLLGTVPVPFTATATFWTRDRVYVLDDSETGAPAITVWRITKSITR